MNYPFINSTGAAIRRLVCVALAVMLLVSLTGCFDLTKPNSTSEAPSQEMPNLLDDDTTPTAATDPSETTEAPTEEPETNIAVVKEQLNLHSSPSNGSNVKAQLEAGERVEVLRIERINQVDWAYVRAESFEQPGWVTAALLDMSNVSAPSSGSDETPAGQAGESTVPDEKPNTNITGNGTKGVVIGSELNIRSEANSTSTRVGGLVYGDRVTITETSNGWGRIKDGWISLEYVYIDGDTGKNPCSGTVSATELRVRSGPGTAYDQVSTLSEGARVDVLEQIKVGNTTWGCIKGGWICMDYVVANGQAGGTITGTAPSGNNNNTSNDGSAIGTATVTSNGLYIRSGAGTNYDTVGALKQGESVPYYEKTTVAGMVWGKISNGWICLDYCKLS